MSIAGQNILNVMPSTSQLAAAGIVANSPADDSGTVQPVTTRGSTLPDQQSQARRDMVVSSPPTLPTVVTSQQWPLSALNSTPSASGNKHVLVPPGLPCLSQRIIDKIVAGEYVDFSELPPARGLS